METPVYSCLMKSPLGELTVFASDGHIIALEFGRGAALPPPTKSADARVLKNATHQLSQYFSGKRKTFDLPLAADGTVFQRRVWRAMNAIAYGRTQTYGALARKLKTSPRAVGGACGANPIPVIQPCHRVLGADGKMVGFSATGGVDTKRALLRIEGADI